MPLTNRDRLFIRQIIANGDLRDMAEFCACRGGSSPVHPMLTDIPVGKAVKDTFAILAEFVLEHADLLDVPQANVTT